mmetsp:Transcript_841/g.1992  ORF Transcript_841/g.1992 Transcript_841/m.1992 type:complete len:211 (-) Transcript_841:1150-1782(-)
MDLPCRSSGAVCQIAPGSPSSACSTGCAVSTESGLSSGGSASSAMSLKRRAASSGCSGNTSKTRSLGRPSGICAVHSTRSSCVEVSFVMISWSPPLWRAASQSSSTSRPRHRCRARATCCGSRSSMSNASESAASTSSSVRLPRSSIDTQPSTNHRRSYRCDAAARARQVLPTPAGPHSVTMRTSLLRRRPSMSTRRWSSIDRPRKGLGT